MKNIVKFFALAIVLVFVASLVYGGVDNARNVGSGKKGIFSLFVLGDHVSGNTWDVGVTTERVVAGSKVIDTGSGMYYGVDFMGTSADDQVVVQDAATIAAANLQDQDADTVLLDKRTPTAKGNIEDYIENGLPYTDGLVVILTDSDVDGVVRYKSNP